MQTIANATETHSRCAHRHNLDDNSTICAGNDEDTKVDCCFPDAHATVRQKSLHSGTCYRVFSAGSLLDSCNCLKYFSVLLVVFV